MKRILILGLVLLIGNQALALNINELINSLDTDAIKRVQEIRKSNLKKNSAYKNKVQKNVDYNFICNEDDTHLVNQIVIKLDKSFDKANLNQEFLKLNPASNIQFKKVFESKDIIKNLKKKENSLEVTKRKQIADQLGLERIYLISFSEDTKAYKVSEDKESCLNLVKKIERLNRQVGVIYAEPNFIVKQMAASVNDTISSPNDLWGVHQIEAPEAWELSRGEDVLVAVVDSGTDRLHPDLTNNVASVSNSNFIDGTGHGTHVAGTIGAVGNNNRGIVGVAYESTLIPIKVLDNNGNGGEAVIAAGLKLAVDLGAKVINASLGGTSHVVPQSLKDACDYAYENDAIIVAAAGNNSIDAFNTYPAAFPTTITVGATDFNDKRALFRAGGGSNYGDVVDIAAPGFDIISTMNNFVPNAYEPHSFENNDYGYYYLEGTSMAAPHVSGVIALMQSYFPVLNLDFARAVLQFTADAISTDKPIGPRVNAKNAMGYMILVKAFAAVDTNLDNTITKKEIKKFKRRFKKAKKRFKKGKGADIRYDIDNNKIIDNTDKDVILRIVTGA